MHIHDLNDDVMMRVIGWLTLIERIQSERGTESYFKVTAEESCRTCNGI